MLRCVIALMQMTVDRWLFSKWEQNSIGTIRWLYSAAINILPQFEIEFAFDAKKSSLEFWLYSGVWNIINSVLNRKTTPSRFCVNVLISAATTLPNYVRIAGNTDECRVRNCLRQFWVQIEMPVRWVSQLIIKFRSDLKYCEQVNKWFGFKSLRDDISGVAVAGWQLLRITFYVSNSTVVWGVFSKRLTEVFRHVWLIWAFLRQIAELFCSIFPIWPWRKWEQSGSPPSLELRRKFSRNWISIHFLL